MGQPELRHNGVLGSSLGSSSHQDSVGGIMDAVEKVHPLDLRREEGRIRWLSSTSKASLSGS